MQVASSRPHLPNRGFRLHGFDSHHGPRGWKRSKAGPLTAGQAKPAVPFEGHYRLIDFVLSSLVHSGYTRIIVLTQYMSHSLDRHLAQTWRLSPLMGSYVATVPAQMRRGDR